MEFKIYNKKSTPLTLQYSHTGSIRLVAVRPDGKERAGGCILEITKEGRFRRYPNVDESVGLHLDPRGRIVEDEEWD